MARKLKMGMIGGGIGSFIGDVHRRAASIDGMIDLVCGAFSSDAEKSIKSGKELFLPDNRCYPSFEEMILKEKQLPEGERMDFVSIVTPNHMHFAPAKLALENGFHVVCDKPMTLTLEEAITLEKIVEKYGADIVDMEVYSILTVLKAYDLLDKTVVIKSVSDGADESAESNSMDNLNLAMENAVAILEFTL